MDRRPLHLVVVVMLALVVTIKIMDIVRDLGSTRTEEVPAQAQAAKHDAGTLGKIEAQRDKIIEALK